MKNYDQSNLVSSFGLLERVTDSILPLIQSILEFFYLEQNNICLSVSILQTFCLSVEVLTKCFGGPFCSPTTFC
jgi:hypothetical protein